MDDAGWPDGRFVMTEAGSRTVEVVADPLDDAQPKPEGWLNKDFVKIEKPLSISVQFADATNSWKLFRNSETNEWQLANAGTNEVLDTSKISSVTSPFNYASFNDVTVAGKESEASTNEAVVTVATADGFDYVISIGQKQNEVYPVRFAITAQLAAERVPGKDEKADEKAKLDKAFKDVQTKLKEKLDREQAFTNWIYQIPTYTVDSLLKHRKDLLEEPKKEADAKSSN